MKNEIVEKYEKQKKKMEEEVRMLRKQNGELMKQMEEYEHTISFLNQSNNPFDSESSHNVNSDLPKLYVQIVSILISNHRETSAILKHENNNLNNEIDSLKEEVSLSLLDNQRLLGQLQECEFNFKSSEINTEILKDQLNNINEEMAILRSQCDKQRKFIQY
jgi:chromosome condensin MukBEF ATPase and DNA-binding subunit MukB